MPTDPPTSRRRSAHWQFFSQLVIGATGLLGTLLCLWLAASGGMWLPGLGATSILVCGTTVLILYRIERSKPVLSPQPRHEEWAEHVRSLRESRLEIVQAYEIERRRIERDLHDGTQQHIVASSMQVGEALFILQQSTVSHSTLPPVLDTSNADLPEVIDLLSAAQDSASIALATLRATVAGMASQLLADRGLEAAVRDLVERSPVDSTLHVPNVLPAIPQPVAATAFFLISEALTNVAKHAGQATATIAISGDRQLHVSIVDTGPGGARLVPGHGLAGLVERLAAFGGTLSVSSPAGGPTSVVARIPLLLESGELSFGGHLPMNGTNH